MIVVTEGNRRITSNTGSGHVYLNVYKAKSMKLLAGVELTPTEARHLSRALKGFAKKVEARDAKVSA